MTGASRREVVVVGLGAMGSASVHQLARRGVDVLGIDRFDPPHDRGSSHGETRITRQALGEGPAYVPLVLRANELWRELEAESGERLFASTGLLVLAGDAAEGPNAFLDTTVATAEQYGIAHRRLTAAEMAREFPQFTFRGDELGYHEAGAGFLRPEACVRTQLDLARRHGADLHVGERFLSSERRGDRIHVTTDRGRYVADKLVLTVGPWVRDVLPERHRDTVRVCRQVLYWFELEDGSVQHRVGAMPVFIWEPGDPDLQVVYGFPSLDGRSLKVATEQLSVATDPDRVDREVSDDEVQAMLALVAPRVRGLTGRCLRAEVCLYSVAPQGRFLLDHHPDDPDVVIASPCSGHGFKHSAAIGEVVADLACGRAPRVDISPFGFDRVGSRPSGPTSPEDVEPPVGIEPTT